MSESFPTGMEVHAPVHPETRHVLTPDALDFFAQLEREFRGRRKELLEKRAARQKELDAGAQPDFLPSTEKIRKSAWTVARIPPDLLDRRVEITGPTDRKMIINALNSGANVFMADFEDSNSPTWRNLIQGQRNLQDAVRRTIAYKSPEGKDYRLQEKTATLLVRPRGWHLDEKHIRLDDGFVSASLFDFAMFFFHNARAQIERGTGPYFYVPKLESREEARLWNDVFLMAQQKLGIPRGTIRATVLIETMLAAFEMDEILYELADHSAGLNCGRWDYIFSFIKKFRRDPGRLLPDRSQVTMATRFLRSYSQLLIQTCHRRGAHAMGGMAAQIPVKDDPAANEEALAKVRADKEREAGDGHDGTWVAHPGLVAVAKSVFDAKMKGPHQIHNLRPDVRVTAADLLQPPQGPITEEGLRTNIAVSLHYLESWLRGQGCVPIRHLMEDAATVEISRAQVWQWITHGGNISGKGRVTREIFRQYLQEEMDRIRLDLGATKFDQGLYATASRIFERFSTDPEFEEFLTWEAYDRLIAMEA